ncbi:hypothetical protein MBLNU459_g6937t1 [Dothideomycetes sp. NU459]
MPIIRNPFRRNDEAARVDSEKTNDAAPKSIEIREPTEYKLSEINDSGVYLPPSPTERKNFWSTKSSSSTNSSNHRSVLNENEPFNISRESFDSYRRSFDISARSPVIQGESRPRASLDSRFVSAPRHSSSFTRPLPPPSEDFEDVGLNDDPKPKKRGFLSRFTDDQDSPDARPTSSHHGFHFSGRKRGQSGQGAELGTIEKPKQEPEVKGGED